jgi:hypothetical protein
MPESIGPDSEARSAAEQFGAAVGSVNWFHRPARLKAFPQWMKHSPILNNDDLGRLSSVLGATVWFVQLMCRSLRRLTAIDCSVWFRGETDSTE